MTNIATRFLARFEGIDGHSRIVQSLKTQRVVENSEAVAQQLAAVALIERQMGFCLSERVTVARAGRGG